MPKISSHQIWATVSGTDRKDLMEQIDALVRWGVDSIEFRVDLIPEVLWDTIFEITNLGVPWWVAHFGVGNDEGAARIAIQRTARSEATGGIIQSRSENLRELITICRDAGKRFAAPYHSQKPMTREAALAEFASQEDFCPAFRKIAVRAHSYEEAAAIVDATHLASQRGGTPVVGAIFGTQRWARIVLPHAGSAITFIVAHAVHNEVGGDDQQLSLADIDHLLSVNDLLAWPR